MGLVLDALNLKSMAPISPPTPSPRGRGQRLWVSHAFETLHVRKAIFARRTGSCVHESKRFRVLHSSARWITVEGAPASQAARFLTIASPRERRVVQISSQRKSLRLGAAAKLLLHYLLVWTRFWIQKDNYGNLPR